MTVRDTGAGIRREFLPQLFTRFTQADSSSTRTHGGLGLGLAIVKHIVDMHGGTVGADSEGEGKGSSLWVTLPRAHSPAQVPAPAAPHGHAGRHRGAPGAGGGGRPRDARVHPRHPGRGGRGGPRRVLSGRGDGSARGAAAGRAPERPGHAGRGRVRPHRPAARAPAGAGRAHPRRCPVGPGRDRRPAAGARRRLPAARPQAGGRGRPAGGGGGARPAPPAAVAGLQPDKLLERRGGGQVGEPEFRRLGLIRRPLVEEPLFEPRCSALEWFCAVLTRTAPNRERSVPFAP